MNLKAIFREGETSRTVHGLTQWDYGRKLEITHPDLPAVLEVHFAVVGTLEAIVRVVSGVEGTAVAAIPDELLRQARPILAWVYIVSETSGESMLTVTLPIRARIKPADEPSVPEKVTDKYAETLEAINTHAEREDNPHGVTPAQIGAAPADTGLWYKRQLTADDDMNALLENGIYTYSTGNLPANCPYENAGVVMVFGSTSATTQRIQFVFRYGTAGQGKFRAYFDGWQEWSDFGGLIESASHPGCYYRQIGSAVEWEDPPMIVGQEYRTTERWNGKPVYIKAVDCGAMPSAGNHKNITIVTGLTANHYILDMKCIFTSNIGGDYNLIRRTVNYCTDVENTTGEITGIAWAFSSTGSSSSVSVTIKAIKDISNNTAIAIVKYTK